MKWPMSTRLPFITTADADALPESVVERIRAGTIDWITLTSPAIAGGCTGFCQTSCAAGSVNEIRLASLSPVTTRGRAVSWLGNRRRSGGIHVGGPGPGDRGASAESAICCQNRSYRNVRSHRLAAQRMNGSRGGERPRRLALSGARVSFQHPARAESPTRE